MTSAVQNLISLLDLEHLELNLFRGVSPKDGWQRVFGGQVVGQALVAATNTVEDNRPCHSLHGYFMRPGDPKVPIIYEVDRIRDGRSFTTRRVVAIQHGHAIFSMSASFHVDEDGYQHQFPMPDVPQPEDLPSERELLGPAIARMPERIQHYWKRERPIEMRPVHMRDFLQPSKEPPHQNIWIRTTGALPDDAALHKCVLGYASDMTLLDTSLLPHATSMLDPQMMLASLDHAMWFHRPFRADNWLLYVHDSPSAASSLGLTRGHIYTR
ncbi:MAG: acyl-CoA thioesterase II, partial [Hyphomicrobiales bacterium]